MGKPMHLKNACCMHVGAYVREPCEVKHLSSMWKINQFRRKSDRDSLSSGERTGICIEIYSLSAYAWRLVIKLSICLNLLSVFFVAIQKSKAYWRCSRGVISGSCCKTVILQGNIVCCSRILLERRTKEGDSPV